jgi:hypothetical protein
MSNLHGIDEIISRIYEDLPVEAKAYVLDGYMESYREMCIVCCAGLKVGLTDADDIRTGQCEDETCKGPSSKSLEEFCEESFWAMHDNIRDAGFDTEGIAMLEGFISAWNHHGYDKTAPGLKSPISLAEAEMVNPYAHVVGAELTRIMYQHSDFIRNYPVDMNRVRIDKEYCRELLQILLQLEA